MATVAPGRASPSVKVAGHMVERDFPTVAQDWDHVRTAIRGVPTGYVALVSDARGVRTPAGDPSGAARSQVTAPEKGQQRVA